MVVMLRASWPAAFFGDGDNWEMRKGVNIVIASGGITIRYEELVDLSDSKT